MYICIYISAEFPLNRSLNTFYVFNLLVSVVLITIFKQEYVHVHSVCVCSRGASIVFIVKC